MTELGFSPNWSYGFSFGEKIGINLGLPWDRFTNCAIQFLHFEFGQKLSFFRNWIEAYVLTRLAAPIEGNFVEKLAVVIEYGLD